MPAAGSSPGSVLLVLSTPLDLVASRLATLRLRPLHARSWSRLALWPAAGLALLALGWWEWGHGAGWGAFVTAVDGGRFRRGDADRKGRVGTCRASNWLFSRRNAIFLGIPFAIAGSWTAYLVVLLIYASVSFYYTQHARRLTPS